LLVPLETFVMGRGPLADLRIDDDSVSRRHALFRIDAASVPTVQDLGSSNGTFVNEQRVAGRTVLAARDSVELGTYRLELVAAARGAGFNEPATRETTRADLLRTRVGLLDELSPRERELFGLLARGLSRRELATRLGVSVKTVETHRTRIGHKLGLRSRAELVGLALKVGVLKPANRPLRGGHP
jgi:DNA-binding CsgD family transcriptional regulator